jgi:chromosome segregation ATPase
MTDVEYMENRMRKAEAERARLEAELVEWKRIADNVQKSNRQYSDEIAKVLTERDELKNTIDLAAAKLCGDRERIAQLEQQVESLQAHLDAAEKAAGHSPVSSAPLSETILELKKQVESISVKSEDEVFRRISGGDVGLFERMAEAFLKASKLTTAHGSVS